MTWAEEITPQELEVVDELKRRNIKDATPGMMKDDSVYYRFAKARDFNLKNAELMLRKHIAWRKEYRVDNILEEYTAPEVLSKYGPTSYMCFDNEGSPVRYLDAGKIDIVGMLNSCKAVDIIKFNILCMEQDMIRLKEMSKKMGKQIQKVVYLYNFDKFNFVKATNRKAIEWFMLGINVYQDNYPERIKTIISINCSFYYTMMFSVVKVIVASAVLAKMRNFGMDGWKEELLKRIDAEDLPAFLGGNRTDPDGNPLCKSFIVHGELVPKSYYLGKSEKKLSRSRGVKKATVSRFSRLEVGFEVEEGGSCIEWEFETKSRDIGFGVFFQGRGEEEGRAVEMVPSQRVDTDYGAETGIFKCEKIGTYLLIFDNSYSWLFQKDIYYKARVIRPSEEAYPDKIIKI